MTDPAAANPSTALARAVVDELARSGVTDVVLAPGSRSTALAVAIAADPRLALHVHVDERSAGFVALGIARASDTPVAVVTTSGSAVANLHPAVVEADLAQVPLVLLTADRPTELRETGANQTIRQAGIFGGAVRWAVDIGAPEDEVRLLATWRATACRAVAHARGLGGPAGPVQVNLGFREPTVPLADDGRAPVSPWRHPPVGSDGLGGRPDDAPWVQVSHATPRAADDTLDAIAAMVAAEPAGLIVVGQARVGPDAVARLAAATRWPVIAEPVGSVRGIDAALVHGHDLCAGGFASTRGPGLVLRIGRTSLSPAVERMLHALVPQILLDTHGQWADPARTVGRIVVGEVSDTCIRLAERVGAAGQEPMVAAHREEWRDAWRAADASVADAVGRVLAASDTLSEPQVVRDVAARVPAGTDLVVASSMPVRDLDRTMPRRGDVRVHANRGASGIDGFVSTALGVALAGAGPCVALAGDLAFLHDANGLLLSPARPVDLTLVVLDNDGGGIFSFLPQATGDATFERVFGTPHGRDLAALAAAHGVPCVTVSSAEALGDALDEALDAGGVRMVRVPSDRAGNVALHERLATAAATAVSGQLTGD